MALNIKGMKVDCVDNDSQSRHSSGDSREPSINPATSINGDGSEAVLYPTKSHRYTSEKVINRRTKHHDKLKLKYFFYTITSLRI